MESGVDVSEALIGHGAAGASSQPTCLIVEDQALISLALEASLEEAGFGRCATFASGAEALEWLSADTPTAAVLDFGLRDGPCTPLVEALRHRAIPFVVYSGHKRDAAPPEFRDVPWLSKPCDRAALLAALIRVAPALADRKPSVAA